jgi:hypothetical protein
VLVPNGKTQSPGQLEGQSTPKRRNAPLRDISSPARAVCILQNKLPTREDIVSSPMVHPPETIDSRSSGKLFSLKTIRRFFLCLPLSGAFKGTAQTRTSRVRRNVNSSDRDIRILRNKTPLKEDIVSGNHDRTPGGFSTPRFGCKQKPAARVAICFH